MTMREEMLREQAMYNRQKQQRRSQRNARPLTEQEKADRAVLSVMKDWPLKPGQMLLLGPKSVAALTRTMITDYSPAQLTDKYILDKSEWGVV